MKTGMGKTDKFLWAVTTILVFAALGVFARVMTSYNHNEDMYIVAGVLAAKGKMLYSDFAFLQSPYAPWFYGILFRFFGISSYYFLVCKSINFLFLTLSAVLIYRTACYVLKDNMLALCMASFLLLNVIIGNAASETSNYMMPVFFSLASFYTFIISFSETRIWSFGIALSGFLLALSMGSKLMYLPIAIPFIVTGVIFFFSEQSGTRWKGFIEFIFVFIAGLVIGLLPMIFICISEPEAFLFNNLKYHLINTQWRETIGFTDRMTLFSKLSYLREVFFQADNLILLVGILLGIILSFSSSKVGWGVIKGLPLGLVLSCSLVIVAMPISFLPTPSWPQYYSMPVSFLLPLLIYSYSFKTVHETLLLKRKVLFILLLLQLAYSGPTSIVDISNLTQRDGWKGFQLHDISKRIQSSLQENTTYTGHERVATLSPLLVIEANIPIYSELSTGSFLYRVGDLLSPDQRSQFVATSPKSISSLFDRDPPVAIIVGFGKDPYDPILNQPLIEYALANNYNKVVIVGFDGDLYVRP